MADKFRFFNIGKANAEIERLEAALQVATNQLSALAGNDSEISAQAEKLSADLSAALSQVSALTEQVSVFTKEKETLAAKVAALPAQVKQEAAAQAVTIVAGVGLKAPLANKPSETPAGEPNPAKALTGLSKVEAAFQAQLDKK